MHKKIWKNTPILLLLMILVCMQFSSIEEMQSAQQNTGENQNIKTALDGNQYEWTWVGGNSTTNNYGVYGTQGIPSDTNWPGARDEFVSWTDLEGNFWIYGGYGYNATQGINYLNDLWRYNTTSGQWTWMKGTPFLNQFGVFGTKGVSSPSNRPGSIQSAISLRDNDGCLWLFGGLGYTETHSSVISNALWRYNISSNEWTWISGGNGNYEYGVYGTKGVFAETNMPGSRYQSSGFIDSAGNIWIFGGNGMAASGFQGALNDVWCYNITLGQWAWVNGDADIGILGVYGSKGIPDPSNKPAGRMRMSYNADNNDNLWITGGFNQNSTQNYYNDIWRYNTTSNEWTWMGGNDMHNQYSVYGTKLVPDANNIMGGRSYPVSWMDKNDNIWICGGRGYTDSGGVGWLNDIWRFNTTSLEFTFMGGNTTTNNQGIAIDIGISDENNVIGARYNMGSFIDNSGNLWLFGGLGYSISASLGRLNDLWRFKITSTENNIVSFSISGIEGINDGQNITITLPYGTSRASLVATFTLSPGATARVGSTVQVSGNTANDFSFPVSYVITAEDGITNKTYLVKVLIAPNTENNILSFSISGVSGVISGQNITITLPAGTSATALVATFTLSPGATARVGSTAQVSGTTANDFSSPVSYVITAEDGVTNKTYIVTVIITEAQQPPSGNQTTPDQPSPNPTPDQQPDITIDGYSPLLSMAAIMITVVFLSKKVKRT